MTSSTPRLYVYTLLVMALLSCCTTGYVAIAHGAQTTEYRLLADTGPLGVHIVLPKSVSILDEAFRDKLRKDIEDKLEKAGVSVFKPREGVTYELKMSTDLRVSIETLDVGQAGKLVCRIQSSLVRPLTLQQPKSLIFRAEVWKSEASMLMIASDQVRSEITKVAMNQAGSFLSDAQKAITNDSKTNRQGPAQSTNAIAPRNVTQQDAQSQTQPISDFPYVASKNSEVFHKSTCASAKKIAVGNIVGYKTREEAIEAGKRPCKRCKP